MSLFNKLVVWSIPFIPKPVVGYLSRDYIAGSDLEDAVETVKQLNAKGMMATLDLLGEEISQMEQADKAADEYCKMLDVIKQEKLDSNVSVKPTHLGLNIDAAAAAKNIERITQKAADNNNFLRIDMEDRHVTGKTIDLYLDLKKKYGDHVGTVIQAYLRRTNDDITRLIKEKANLRLCKGIYVEPREVAFKDMAIINESFKYNLERLLKNGCYVGIATHDEKLVYHAMSVIGELNIPKEAYEFQMLLGVDEQLRDIIVKAGHRLRVYIPYGRDWYAYSTRRMKENPRMAGMVAKKVFGFSA